MLSPLDLLELAPNPMQPWELFISCIWTFFRELLYSAISCFVAHRKACVCLGTNQFKWRRNSSRLFLNPERWTMSLVHQNLISGAKKDCVCVGGGGDHSSTVCAPYVQWFRFCFILGGNYSRSDVKAWTGYCRYLLIVLICKCTNSIYIYLQHICMLTLKNV